MDIKTNLFIFAIIAILGLRAVAIRIIENPDISGRVRRFIKDYCVRCKKGYLIFKQNLKTKRNKRNSDDDKKA